MQRNKTDASFIDETMLIEDGDDIYPSSPSFQKKKISTKKLLQIYRLVALLSLILFIICLIILLITLTRKKQQFQSNNSSMSSQSSSCE